MDRLSELPDSIIFHIFSFLPMNDVVRTTILSKQWINLWTTTPFLNFRNDTRVFPTSDKLRNFVNRSLLLWNGVRVLKFKVDSWNDKSLFGDIDLWVRFAKKYQVQELYLHMRYTVFGDIPDHDRVCWVPSCLYSCSSLNELSIRNCYFRIHGDVQWDQLKSLTITECFGISQHVIDNILWGSPQLEVFILSIIERGDYLCIESSSLKKLSIFKYLGYSYGPIHTKLSIWTPNLETLEIRGNPYNKCIFIDVSSLTRATLGFSGLHYYDDDSVEDDSCDVSSANHYLGGLFSQTLPSIQHVENITLSPCCVQVLGAMIERCMNSHFSNVKSLQLGYYIKRYPVYVGVIEILPQLKKLVLKVREKDEYYDARESLRLDREIYLKFEANIPKSFVRQLKVVEVTWVEDDNVFPFLQFLLKYGCTLQKMVFRVKETMPPSPQSRPLLLASDKLLKMPRSSPSARFIFGEGHDSR